MHYISDMADVVGSAAPSLERDVPRARRRRDDLWIGTTALVAALLALPLAQSSWHGPEAAAVLAVSATAMLAGQRWAIALVAIAELLLAPTVASRAFLGGLALWPGRVAALGAVVAIVPGLLSLRRAAAALVIVTGQPRTRATYRRFHVGLLAVGVLAVILPFV
jgi:hypothetical protein